MQRPKFTAKWSTRLCQTDCSCTCWRVCRILQTIFILRNACIS